MDDLQFRQLLDYFCYSWDGYRRVRKGLKNESANICQKIAANLYTEGFLIIGSHGKLPVVLKWLIPFGDQPFVFKKLA